MLKKTINFISSLALLGLVMLSSSCEKNKVESFLVHGSSALSIPPPIDNQNYCGGCGYSSDASFCCETNNTPDGVFYSTCSNCGTIIPDDICLVIDANNLADSLGYIDSIDRQQCYALRDSLLINYLHTQYYITYYNLISQKTWRNNLLNSTNITDYILFANQLKTKGNILLHGADSSVVFDSTFMNVALNYIAIYRQIDSNDVFYQESLNQIESDLINCVGYTKSQIFSYLLQ
jgi:hypothetical protein